MNATNHTDKRRWNHTRNGRGEEQPKDKRVAWLRTSVKQGSFCQDCGAWSGSLGLEPTPDLFVEHMVEVFRLVREVLADDGTLWLNLGDCYAGTPAGNGRGTLPERAGLGNGGATPHRSTSPHRGPGLKPKDLCGMPWRVAFALQADGWYLRSDIIWHKPNAIPESVTDRPSKAHEYLFLLSKSARYYYDHKAIKEPAKWRGQYRTVDATYQAPGQRKHTGLRTKDLARSGNKERKLAATYGRPDDHRGASIPWEGDMRNKRTVWSVNTKPFRGAHFAVYPPELIEPCILAGSRSGDKVIDPFAGTGTTGMVAEQLGRRFVGIELNPDYSALARESGKTKDPSKGENA